jgi:hypothetical protein
LAQDVFTVAHPFAQDVFTVAPRHLAESYFGAVRECLNGSLREADFQRGAGPTEELLLRHLTGPHIMDDLTRTHR